MADMLAINNAAADAAGIPRLLLLACGIAEGNLNPNARRPVNPADDARYWPDVSGGVWQQTVRWDPDYHGGAAYPGPEEVARVLALQFDPERSARVAAANLTPKWRQYQPDIFATLCAYNWPAGGGKPASAAAAANYRRGIAEAEPMLAGSTPTKPAPTTDPWDRTQLITDGFSTPAEWPIAAPRPIQAICWHDMEGHLPGAIARWNTGAAGAHLCVLEDGTIVRTVLIENIAWHAGTNNDPNGGLYGRTPFWRTHNINPYSIGIELEGFVASGYTQAQIDACVKIGIWAQATYGIAPVHTVDQIQGHHLHGELSSSRTDPGPLFPFAEILQRIAQGGIHVSDPPEPLYAQPGQVGTGLLEMMAEDGTVPAMPSTFLPLGASPSVAEQCYGMNGRLYLFHIPTGRRWRYDPAA